MDAIVVPVGGGGMLSGITIAAKGLQPKIKIFAAEPLNASDCSISKQKGTLVPHEKTPISCADGLLTSLGSNTWPVVRDLVDEVITVSEVNLLKLMKFIFFK